MITHDGILLRKRECTDTELILIEKCVFIKTVDTNNAASGQIRACFVSAQYENTSSHSQHSQVYQ
jgi:hypothetical protein